ncbi:uncharacterized protein SPAPADRAFT_141071 [Spathaspora passalidarum NRRL Y-27907]|uniref:Uncharacterized protein n=1 Tax=Spathaspora passalidarum (strain NRRL Y-27907 / 11-Y1) TaxID=619300 RepID=G3AQY0_SPAPN|nr:uncharacterized protein SPAPADRAFT_141071 [Spathaspora passalidarum NRRL Y-27907]EGW31209.1 hypothetical protein SPAPADRAFT_141071 [Spathaspora passalidarum NRRL Y-27907]
MTIHSITSGTNSPIDNTSPHFGGSLSVIGAKPDPNQYKKDNSDSSAPQSKPASFSPDPPDYPHSYHASNPRSRSISTPTRIALSSSENKICQWYCCSCGQSYGSVIYKDADGHVETREEHERNNNTDPNTNYILDNLKYYSQVVYRDHLHTVTNIPRPNNDNHSMRKSKSSEPMYSDCIQPKPMILNYTSSSPPSPTMNPVTTPLMSPISLDLQNNNTINYQERIIISAPTRFTCHRCDHMMCPYCPKLRLKDLDR